MRSKRFREGEGRSQLVAILCCCVPIRRRGIVFNTGANQRGKSAG
ncbi:hypothetical protein chiPu_0023365, partial [Chiloscyllium punctatum]|nr:hypothetical protein [Chiloscyllium punctatum]